MYYFDIPRVGCISPNYIMYVKDVLYWSLYLISITLRRPTDLISNPESLIRIVWASLDTGLRIHILVLMQLQIIEFSTYIKKYS